MTGKKLSLPPLAESLSARLLLLTIAFVMLAEVLIYAPSIGRFRLVYLEERLAAAHLAILALEATPDQMIGEDLKRELL
ncbi:MAG: sensor histidine kinase, partial [Proteobacteria bacterium]|nr:sensor histidine kinase [Pseudomonadota bacterium]